MCHYGRLNYQWVGRQDRLVSVITPASKTQLQGVKWPEALNQISAKLKEAPSGSTAIIASARQSNEELYLLAKLAKKLGALTDSVPRTGESDKLLLNSDRNPNSNSAW